MNTPRLIKIDTGEAFPLECAETIVGRADECALVVRDDSVSSRHAAIRLTPDGGLSVRDLGSTNGTTVNDVRISEAQLVTGQRVAFGGVAFQLRSCGATPPPFPVPPEPPPMPTTSRSDSCVAEPSRRHHDWIFWWWATPLAAVLFRLLKKILEGSSS